MRALNRRYRNKNKTTDVLSFALREGMTEGVADGIAGAVGSAVLGDIVISVDTARRQAVEYSMTVKEELLRLLIHGLLHLFGYDHEHVTQREAKRMRRKERFLFSKSSRLLWQK
jgi:probable rRNA maturation factor